MYVEVIYLKNGEYLSRKFQDYKDNEAELVYVKTIKKLESDKVSSLISLRNEEHCLIKSHRVK